MGVRTVIAWLLGVQLYDKYDMQLLNQVAPSESV